MNIIAEKPKALEPNFENIPSELQALETWTLWNYQLDKRGNWKKPPCTPDGRNRVGDQKSWKLHTFEDVQGEFLFGDFAGIGIVFIGQVNAQGWCLGGVDIDKVVGTPQYEIALKLMDDIGCRYVELSPSGQGLRGFGWTVPCDGKLNERADRYGLQVEMATGGTYYTITGTPLPGMNTLSFMPGFASLFAELKPPKPPVTASQDVAQWVGTADDVGDLLDDPITPEKIADIKSELAYLAANGFGQHDKHWNSVFQCLKAGAKQEGGKWVAEMFELWKDYSKALEGHDTPPARREAKQRWRGAGGDRAHLNGIFKIAKKLRAGRGGDIDLISDMELASNFAASAQGGILYEHSGRGWLIYDCGAWKPCTVGQEVTAVQNAASSLMERAKGLQGDAFKSAWASVKRAMSAPGVAATLQLAKSDPRLRAHPSEFDRDPWTLNVQNGVVNLRTGELMPHDQTLRLSRQCSVPLENTPTPRWIRFLNEISCGDADWVAYLQRSLGYALTGSVQEEKLVFWLGSGANGKSVLANVLRRILGNYCQTLPPNLLIQSNRDGESATPAMAALPGARLVLLNEIEAGSRLSGQSVKTLVSTEAISARHLYGSQFSFIPTHKAVIRGNHRPIISDNDDGIWRRIHLLPFNAKFSESKRDIRLEETLMAESPGILAWMIEGAVRYCGQGLGTCKAVQRESEAYRQESDLIGQWIDEDCEVGQAFDCPRKELYDSWGSWCRRNGHHQGSMKSFVQRLQERGFQTFRESSGCRQYRHKGFRVDRSFEMLF